jgi:hypothetical protein
MSVQNKSVGAQARLANSAADTFSCSLLSCRRYTGSENDIEIEMAKQLPAMMRAKYLLMAIIPLLMLDMG